MGEETHGRSCVPRGVNHHRAPLGHGLACTNEANATRRESRGLTARNQRPYGQNPTATRPRLRGHTREHNCRPHGRDTEDTLAPAISQSCSWTLVPGTFSGTWMGNLVSLMSSAYDSPTLRGPSFISVGLADPLRSEFFSCASSPTLYGPSWPDGPLRPGRNPAYQLCDYGARYRFRTGVLYCSHW